MSAIPGDQLPSVGCLLLMQNVFHLAPKSRVLRRVVGRPYLTFNQWVWTHLPSPVRRLRLLQAYGRHLHWLIQLREPRWQRPGTFFFRNRPELKLLTRLLDDKALASTANVAVLACSKGAEVYSLVYAIRRARPDLKLRMHAVDIAEDVLDFARRGTYALTADPVTGNRLAVPDWSDVARNTFKEQTESIFERMSSVEMEAMFDRLGEIVTVKPQFRQGTTWSCGDAGDPQLLHVLGLQDIVIANRFLCHMEPDDAERCLRGLARLVRPGGYLFVSGVDLRVRSKVASDLGWTPVTELIREIHDGDPSLRRDWPLQYWGLEPLDQGRSDWEIRYASVFQIGGTGVLPDSASSPVTSAQTSAGDLPLGATGNR
jgi:chemotaxis methyl-accepting protein methylase